MLNFVWRISEVELFLAPQEREIQQGYNKHLHRVARLACAVRVRLGEGMSEVSPLRIGMALDDQNTFRSGAHGGIESFEHAASPHHA